ncbi:hypothetical protein RZS08_39955, partial [Arthrospira platensis SPKY1]|nr:hypothetical protein [Arthrospira platensis SPKY1]
MNAAIRPQAGAHRRNEKAWVKLSNALAAVNRFRRAVRRPNSSTADSAFPGSRVEAPWPPRRFSTDGRV